MTYGLMSTETQTYLADNSVTGWGEMCASPRGMTKADTYVCHLFQGHEIDCLYGPVEELEDCYEISLICDGALDEVFSVSLQASPDNLDTFMQHLKRMLDIEMLGSYIIEAQHFVHQDGDTPAQIIRFYQGEGEE